MLNGAHVRLKEIGSPQGTRDLLNDVDTCLRRKESGAAMTSHDNVTDIVERIAPLLEELETGQDCAEYAYAKGKGFQAMTYCPEAFEALKELPEYIHNTTQAT